MGFITILLSSLDKNDMHGFSLKFCGGGSSLETFEGEAMQVMCCTVYQQYSYQIIIIGWVLFRLTRKPEAVLRIPTRRPISRRYELQPEMWCNHLDSTNEAVVTTSVLSNHTKKLSKQ
jgi:hypothetical protein